MGLQNLILTFKKHLRKPQVRIEFSMPFYTIINIPLVIQTMLFYALCTSGVCEKPRTQVANSFLNCDLQLRIESRRPIYPVIDIIDYSSNILFMLYTRALCQKPHFKAAKNVKKSILSSKRIQHGCVTLK